VTPDPDRLLSLTEAAARLGKPANSLRLYRDRWGIPWLKVGRDIKFRKGDLDTWIAARPGRDPVAEAVRKTVEAAPLLTAAQRDELRTLLDTSAAP
jgi:Helix-turn-helix domain